MFKINNLNKIILTKGDNAQFDIRIYNKEGEEVEIKPDDVITLTVKKNADGEAVITKTAEELNTIYFIPNDTEDLDAGLYVYDIQYENGFGEINTIVSSFFEIIGEITE